MQTHQGRRSAGERTFRSLPRSAANDSATPRSLPHRTPDYSGPSILSRRLEFVVSEARQGKLKVLTHFEVVAIVSGPLLRLEIPWEVLDD